MLRHICPECTEPAVPRPPTTLVPYAAHGIDRPTWSHLDGSPLCPVVGSINYEPVRPVPRSGRSLEDTTGCPRGDRCDVCETTDGEMGVVTVSTSRGVYCVIVCPSHTDVKEDEVFWYSVPDWIEEHCDHIGMTVEEMRALLAAEDTR